MAKAVDFSDLTGKTITTIRGMNEGSDEIEFMCADGTRYLMSHEQECCESVTLDDVCGDPRDIMGSTILQAEESVSSDTTPAGVLEPADLESYMWTFYKLATIQGYVTLRWLGSSNGHYSESVSFSLVQ